MPLAEFAFVIDSTPRNLVKEDGTKYTAERPAGHEVLRKAREVFGAKTRFVELVKVTGGNIRYFKNRGMRVTKTAGRFYVNGDLEKRIVRAVIDVPQEYFIKKMGGTPGAVDLSELGNMLVEAGVDPEGPNGYTSKDSKPTRATG